MQGLVSVRHLAWFTDFQNRHLARSVSCVSTSRHSPTIQVGRIASHHQKERCPIASAPSNNEPRINDRIRAREVRLVDQDGTQLGIKPLPQALNIARDADLDLVEVAPMANPPVCRIMNYGKFKFDAAQQAREARRKAQNVSIKEMKYRVKIGPGDFETKTRKVAKFLAEGHKVKLTIMFRGREMDRPQYGKKILDQVAEEVSNIAKVEYEPRLDGRNMIMVLAPDKKAQEAAKKEAENSQGSDAEQSPQDSQGTPAPAQETNKDN